MTQVTTKKKTASSSGTGSTKARSDSKLLKKFKAAEEEKHRLNDKLLRSLAELDNYRKRTDREKKQLVQNANQDLIRDLLPVLDDFERSLKTAPSTKEAAGFHRGVQMIYQKMMSILQSYGLEPVESAGDPFDVDRHDALLQVENDQFASGIIIEEHEKGYFLNGQVLRHAKVVVSK